MDVIKGNPNPPRSWYEPDENYDEALYEEWVEYCGEELKTIYQGWYDCGITDKVYIGDALEKLDEQAFACACSEGFWASIEFFSDPDVIADWVKANPIIDK